MERARALLEDLSYDKALKQVELALEQERVDRETLVALYEIEAVCWANLSKPARATESFRRLLTLSPGFVLSRDNPPRVRTPYFEAKEWVDKNGALVPVLEKVDSRDGRVRALTFWLGRDPLRQLKALNLELEAAGAQEVAHPAPKVMRFTVPVVAVAAAVKYRLELIGARGAVLGVLVGEAKAEALPALPPPTVRPEARVAALPPAPAVAATEAPRSRAKMGVGVVLTVAGVVGLAAGGYFGVQAASARQRLLSVTTDADGAVIGMTQAEARLLDSRATTGAVIADGLLVGGGVLAALGLTLMVIDLASAGPEAAQVRLSWTGRGAWVSGQF
ncbi:MAG: hypothetical protein IPJ65_09385 [Archangiaceae bacterium]|nr:hypothetical protein [Archangiaceae bacterium]